MADEGKVDTTIRGQMNSLSKEAGEFSNGMSKRLYAEVKLKDIENEHREKIIEDLQNEGKIKDPANLTKEENLLVVRGLNKIRNTKVLESVRKIAKEFFDKEQKKINDMQTRYDELKKAADIEAKKVQEELKVLQDKQRAHEEDSNSPELTEEEKKQLRELIKKNRYFAEDYPKKLSVMNQRISAARDTIELQKKLLNAECQDRFGGWAVNNKAPNKSQEKDGTIGNNEQVDIPKQDNKDEQRNNEEKESVVGNNQNRVQGGMQSGPVMYGGTQGSGVPHQQQVAPNNAQFQGAPSFQGGGQGSPVNNGNQQNAPTNPTEQQTSEKTKSEERIPTDEELLGEESPILRFDGENMTSQEALEIIQKYSNFSIEDIRICLRNNGLDVIKKAVKILNEKGASLSNQEKELFLEFSKNISNSSKELAKFIKKESFKSSKNNPLSSILDMNSKDKKYKEIEKYFVHGINFPGMKERPLVIFDYNNIPDDIKDRLESALSKERNDLIDKEGFDRTFGDVIRIGKALGYSKEIEEIATEVRNRVVEEAEKGNEQQEVEAKKTEKEKIVVSEEEINAELKREARVFIKELNEKYKNGETITLAQNMKMTQYNSLGILDTLKDEIEYSIDENSPEFIEFSKSDERYQTDVKYHKIMEALDKGEIAEGVSLNSKELNILISGYGLIKFSQEFEKYVPKNELQEYREKYDLRYQAEKRIENGELTPELPVEEVVEKEDNQPEVEKKEEEKELSFEEKLASSVNTPEEIVEEKEKTLTQSGTLTQEEIEALMRGDFKEPLKKKEAPSTDDEDPSL